MLGARLDFMGWMRWDLFTRVLGLTRVWGFKNRVWVSGWAEESGYNAFSFVLCSCPHFLPVRLDFRSWGNFSRMKITVADPQTPKQKMPQTLGASSKLKCNPSLGCRLQCVRPCLRVKNCLPSKRPTQQRDNCHWQQESLQLGRCDLCNQITYMLHTSVFHDSAKT